MQLIVLVINDIESLEAMLEAWSAAGATGITVLPSTGIGHLMDYRRDEYPLFSSLDDLFENNEFHHRTLFTVVQDETLVEQLIEAAQRIIGDFNIAHTGMLFTVPIGRMLGLGRRNE